MGDAIPRLAVLGSMRKEAEQDIGSKPASRLSTAYNWLLCVSLEPFHQPEFLSMFSAYRYASENKELQVSGHTQQVNAGDSQVTPADCINNKLMRSHSEGQAKWHLTRKEMQLLPVQP